jgi:anti-sigma B factor antagonist
MTTPLTLTSGHGPDGTTLLTAAGEIDMSNTHTLAAALETTPGPVILDLTDVEYLDSAGLSVLFAHADRIQLIVNPILEPVPTLTGLTDIAAVRPPATPA